MYLYVDINNVNSIIPGLQSSPLALLPSTRGRPAKGHAKIPLTDDLDVYIAAIDHADFAAKGITQPETLKALTIAGELAGYAPPAVNKLEVATLLALAINALMQSLPNEYLDAMPANLRKQLVAVKDGIKRELNIALSDDDENTESVYELITIISENKRLLNSVIGNNQNGEGWFYTDITVARAPAVAVTTAGIDLTSSEGTDNEMATATVSFGFGKLSGNDAPALKVTEDPTKEAEVNGVFLPKPDETYIINEQVAQLFKILQISRKNCPQNINLIGPHGCGKTELAIQFAARLNLPLLIMDCANLREARDWFGYKSARDGTVFWHESQFVKAVEAGNHVILLDELNRANPHLLNTLMPLLDARRFTYLEEKGDKICVGPGTVFFASMNEGAGYTGTSALDRAIRDRFPRVVELTYLGEDDEINLLVKRVGVSDEIATRLVQMANKIRQDASGLSATLTESLSTRQLIAAAHDFAIGGVDTLTFTVSNHFSADGDDDSERVRVQNIIQGKFGDLLAAKAAQTAAAKKGA